MAQEKTWRQWWENHELQYRTPDKIDIFATSGADYVAQFLQELKSFAPRFNPATILDFGCGPGRILAPLGRAFPDSRLIGVDISDSILSEAKTAIGREFSFVNCTREQIPAGYDLVHSFIVFQHIPVAHGLQRVSEILDKLAPGGIGALHFAYANEKPLARRVAYAARKWIPGFHWLADQVAGKPHYPFTEMNQYPLQDIFRLLQHNGCHRIGASFSNHEEHLGVRLMFEKISLTLL